MRADFEIESKLLDLAYRNIRPMLFVNFAAAIGAALTLKANGLSWAYEWLTWMAMLTAVRYLFWRVYCHAAKKDRISSAVDLGHWRHSYAAGLYFAAASWTVLSIAVLAQTTPEAKYTLIIIIAALAGGATGVTAPLLREGRLYIGLLLLPGSLYIGIAGQNDQILAVLGLIFVVVMMIGHANNHRIVKESLELRRENEELVGNLRTLNSGLEDKVAERTEALIQIANRDALTQLPNRRALLDWMGRHLFADKPGEAAILFLDLDRFKQINDALGHDIGDDVLKSVAGAFERCLPEEAILARWGGDEFVVVTRQSEAARAQAHKLAQAIIASVSGTFTVRGETIGLGVSIGRAHFPTDAASFSEVIQLADLAVTEVKRSERGRLQDYTEAYSATQKRR
jgi:diguanylate cyclase (GGDEF)-like protein